MHGFRQVITLLSLVVAATCMALTLGLWERSRADLRNLLDVVGRYTWQVSSDDGGEQSVFLPHEPEVLETLKSWPGVERVAIETGIAQMLGSFNYAASSVSQDFFSIRRFAVAQGRSFETPDEAVVGSKQAALLGQEIPVGLATGSKTVKVVGVLESLAERGDYFADDAVYIPIESDPLPIPQHLYLEVSAEYFAQTKPKLEAWLKAQGLERYQVQALSEQYGLELREKVARLLGSALGFGVLAACLVAMINLSTYFSSQMLSHLRSLGIRRAVGASQKQIVLEEVLGTLPWSLLGFVLSLPCIVFINIWFKQTLGLYATPGPLTMILLIVFLVALVDLSSFTVSVWAAQQDPAQAIRGFASRLFLHRKFLAGLGLSLGLSAFILQATSSTAATLETRRILGDFANRVATIGSFDAVSSFADPRMYASLSSGDYQAFLNTSLSQKFSRSSFIKVFPIVTLQGDKSQDLVSLMAYSGDYPELVGVKMIEGRLPNSEQNELILGQQLAQNLFSEPLGKSVSLFGREWQIVGIFQAAERGVPGGASDMKVLLPGQSIRAKGEFNFVVLEHAPDQSEKAFDEAAAFFTARFDQALYRPFQALRPDRLPPPDIIQTLRQLSGIYQVLGWMLLLLGGSGLAIHLLSMVIDRTQEIGIRRAVGATQAHILISFLRESLGLGLLASGLGLILGALISYLVAQAQQMPFAPSAVWFLLSLGLGLIVSLLFGFIPSYLAAHLAPANAFRKRSV